MGVHYPAVEPVVRYVGKSRVLTPAEVAEFGRRMDQLRAATQAKIGEEDARYIYRVRDFVRYSEIASRSLLMFGGWLPPVWLFASVLLGVSKIVENMELGHNVIHGQYDWMNDPSLHGDRYDWDVACASKDWKYTHNYLHHTYTNILGYDGDLGYGIIRITPEQPWHPLNVLNIPIAIVGMFSFQWFIGLQNTHFEAAESWQQAYAQGLCFFKKAARQIGKDYVFFPLLAGPMALPVLAGNITANLIRNLWAFAVIYCGHFTEDVEIFADNVDLESKAEWYLRQLKGSSNLSGGRIFNLLSGNLAHQIEHHLFPDMPAYRYQEMAPEVRAICAEFDQYYNTGSLPKQLGSVFKRFAVYSLPNDAVSKIGSRLRRLLPRSLAQGRWLAVA